MRPTSTSGLYALAIDSAVAAQRGAALLESLVAFVLRAIGVAAVVKTQVSLRLHADLARPRSEAVRLGRREIEKLRAYSTIAATAKAVSYADIADGESVFDASTGDVVNTACRVVRHVDDASIVDAKAVQVVIEWIDRRGDTQRPSLETMIARADPAYSGALAIGTVSNVARGAFGRSPAIPASAAFAGRGRSAWKPTAVGNVVLVVDDASGQIVSQCTGVTAAMRDLVAGDLTSCIAGHGLLLSGTVRFSAARPPLAGDANAVPVLFSVALALAEGGDGTEPRVVEAMKPVRRVDDGGLHIAAVALAATPQSEGVASWEETGERFAACRRLARRWPLVGSIDTRPGRLDARHERHRPTSVPFRDRPPEGSGTIDANIEHPADYRDVDATLSGQNFLVVRSDQDCPTAAAADPFPDATNTVPHQP